MNARGSTEVIVATIGLSMGALSQDLFTMIVTMAILTTLAMPPTLRWALARLPMRKEEKERLEREEMEAKGFVSKLERLLVAVDDSANGQFGSRVAGMIAGTRSMPTTVMHITARKNSRLRRSPTSRNRTTPKEKEKAAEEEAKERAEAAAQLLKDAAEQMKRRRPKDQKNDRTLDVTVIANTTTETEVVAEEAEKGYDLLVVGLDKTTIRDNTGFHANITQLASGFDGPLVIVDARDGLLNNPTGRQAQHSGAGERHRTVAPRRRGRLRHGARQPRAGHGALCGAARQRRQEAVAPHGRRHAQGHRRAGRELRRRCQDRGADRNSWPTRPSSRRWRSASTI